MSPPRSASFRIEFPGLRAGSAALLMLAPQLLLAGVPSVPSAPLVPVPASGPWTFTAGVAGRTGYDSNVLLQDFGDQAEREAWVSSLSAQLALTYQPNPLFKMMASYAPEGVFYEGQSDENHVTHRGALNFSGKSGDTAWEWLNGVVRIDGSSLGPRFTLNHGTQAAQIPAAGGVPIRDRRDAAIYKNSFRLTQTFGQAFVRPSVSFYHHNFMTERHLSSEPGFLGYENYVDRQEIGGGLDLGYEAWSGTWLVGGLRAGHQKHYENQYGRPSPYSNSYFRILGGIEGAPATWLKLNVLAGPDFRDFDEPTPPGFERDKVYLFIDASATITPTVADAVTLQVKRYMQPSFTSHCLYEDIVYEAGYRHRFDSRFSAGAGFKAYRAEFRPPASRNDWIYTPSLALEYSHGSKFVAELAYSYDWAESGIPHTEGREFSRHLVWLGLKHSF